MSDDDLKIIIVDNELNARETLRDLLESRGYHVSTAGDGVEALRSFEETAFDVVFTELQMPRMGGLELLNRLKERFPEAFVVLLTRNGPTELAVQATKNHGAFDCIPKPPDQKRLFTLINKVAEHRRFLRKNVYAHEERRKTYRFENIIGKTPQMFDIFHKIQDVASADIPVLVTGERNSGACLSMDKPWKIWGWAQVPEQGLASWLPFRL